MNETIVVNLTLPEIDALKRLIHFAVQARGMEVAEAGVVLVKKLDEAVNEVKQYPRAAE